MRAQPWLGPILDDDALTRGLGDAEARVLVEWLVEQAERLGREMSATDAGLIVRRLCRRARGIARFVSLWNAPRSRGAAAQLAVAEGFHWPLPDGTTDPCELMQTIVLWEEEEMARARPAAA
jgi:hypothetical protein